MTIQEMAKVLTDTKEQKVILFDEFLQRLLAGQTLSEAEVGIFETLKSMLVVEEE